MNSLLSGEQKAVSVFGVVGGRRPRRREDIEAPDLDQHFNPCATFLRLRYPSARRRKRYQNRELWLRAKVAWKVIEDLSWGIPNIKFGGWHLTGTKRKSIGAERRVELIFNKNRPFFSQIPNHLVQMEYLTPYNALAALGAFAVGRYTSFFPQLTPFALSPLFTLLVLSKRVIYNLRFTWMVASGVYRNFVRPGLDLGERYGSPPLPCPRPRPFSTFYRWIHLFYHFIIIYYRFYGHKLKETNFDAIFKPRAFLFLFSSFFFTHLLYCAGFSFSSFFFALIYLIF